MAELPVRDAFVIRPGDHLIIRVDRELDTTSAEAAEMRETLLERLPGLGGVTVVSADGLYVFRDEKPDGAVTVPRWMLGEENPDG